MRDRTNPTTNASTALKPGNTHNDPVTYSLIVSRFLMSDPLEQRPCRPARPAFRAPARAAGWFRSGRGRISPRLVV